MCIIDKPTILCYIDTLTDYILYTNIYTSRTYFTRGGIKSALF